MQSIEKMLDDAFKKVPSLPEEGRKWLATAMPWLALIGGILSLWGAWGVLQILTWSSQFTSTYNELQAYGYIPATTAGTMSMVGWVGIAVLVAQGVLMLIAFTELRSGRKRGWDLVLCSAFVSIAYAVVNNLFMGYFNLTGLVGNLIGSAIGLYLLFQVRPYFVGTSKEAKIVTDAKTEVKKDDKPKADKK